MSICHYTNIYYKPITLHFAGDQVIDVEDDDMNYTWLTINTKNWNCSSVSIGNIWPLIEMGEPYFLLNNGWKSTILVIIIYEYIFLQKRTNDTVIKKWVVQGKRVAGRK